MPLHFKLLAFLVLALIGSSSLQAQRKHTVILPEESMEVEDCYFFIRQVIDLREDSVKIGEVKKGAMNTPCPGIVPLSLNFSLRKMIAAGLPYKDDFVPVDIKVNHFEILETKERSAEICILRLELEFICDDQLIYVFNEETRTVAVDALHKHGENIHKAMKKCLQELSKVMYKKGLYGGLPFKYESFKEESTVPSSDVPEHTTDDYVPHTPAEGEKQSALLVNRNVNTLGYQIGGLTLIGYDFEVRVSDVIGVHLGAGLAGFTGGVKLHTGPEKKSSYFNLSYKDGGFGLLNGVAGEFGGTLFKLNKKTDLGLHAQVGLMGIIDIDPEMEQLLFDDEPAPDVILSIGLGFSW